MKQKGGNFESSYKMSHISNIDGLLTSNKIIAKGNDKGINIITQKNNDKPEHIFINLNQYVNKLDKGEKDLFFKLNKLMNENEQQPLIIKNNLNALDKFSSKKKLSKRKASKSDKRKASKSDKKKTPKSDKRKASKSDKKKKKTNKRWKHKKNKTLKKKKQPSLFDVF